MTGNEIWPILAGLASIVIALLAYLGFVNRAGEKALTLREHVEFKGAINNILDRFHAGQQERLTIKNFDDWKTSFIRELDQIRDEIIHIEQRVPTTGELEKMFQNIDARLVALERRIAAQSLKDDAK